MVLHLLSIAKQIDELLSALKQHATGTTLSFIPSVLAEARLHESTETPIPHRESLVCELVMEAFNAHDSHIVVDQPTAIGLEVVATLQDYIFGHELRQSPFLQLVCCQSYEKACIARLACIRLLEREVTPSNCFTLLHLAARLKLPSLAAAAKEVALTDFTEASLLDTDGFAGLPCELLGEVVSSDELVAESEEQVYASIAQWVVEDRDARLPLFHTLVERGVRLSCMSRGQLFEVDTHPLTLYSKEVMQAIARAYLEVCYGTAQRQAPRRGRRQHTAEHAQADAAGEASQGAPVHQQLPQWGCQPAPAQTASPECSPMDCCTGRDSPPARSPGPAYCLGFPESSSEAGVSSAAASAVAAKIARMTASSAARERRYGRAGSSRASGSGSQGVAAAEVGTAQASPLDEDHQRFESCGMLSPLKRKAPASPEEELEPEAMHADKMPRYSSCRKLRFF